MYVVCAVYISHVVQACTIKALVRIARVLDTFCAGGAFRTSIVLAPVLATNDDGKKLIE